MMIKLSFVLACAMMLHSVTADSPNMYGVRSGEWEPSRRQGSGRDKPKRNRQNVDDGSMPGQGNKYGHHSMNYGAKTAKGHPHGHRLLEEDEFSISIHSGKSLKSDTSGDSLDSDDERRLRRGGRRMKKKPWMSLTWHAKYWKPDGSSGDLTSTSSSSEDFSFSLSIPSTVAPTPDPSFSPSVAPSMAPTQETMQLCSIYISYVEAAEANHTVNSVTSWWSACGDVDPTPHSSEICPSGLVLDNICQSVDFDVPIESDFCEPLLLPLSNDTDVYESCMEGCMKYVSIMNGGDCCYLDCDLDA